MTIKLPTHAPYWVNSLLPRGLPSLLTGLLLTASAQAQELRLFEPIETEPGEQVMNAPEQVFTQGNGQPAYTLRSISRFGDQFQAVLIGRSGDVVKVNWNDGEQPPVANTGFSVVAAGSGSLSLMHPPGDVCVRVEATGVDCSAPNRSELQLFVAVPLASNGAVMAPMPAQPADAGFFGNDPRGNNGFVGMPPGQEGQQVFINPFSGEPEVLPQLSEEERQQRIQRQEARAERLRQFEQNAFTDDADIPPGMQRVRTPFGDRFIQNRE